MELPAPVADDETTRLVLQMQLDDFYELSERRRGKQKEHTPPDDFWIAVDLYHAELESAKRTLSDGKMSLSIAMAVRDDGNLISEWAGQEAQAAEDRKLAMRLGTGKADKDHHDGPQPTDKGGSATDHDDELLDRLAALYVFGPDDQETETDAEEAPAQPESSSWAASRRTPQKNKQQRQCAICLDQFPPHEVARAPCAEHEYCGRCVADLFTRSLTDESLFPPRCCGQPISIASGGVRIFLAPELVDAFLARTLEMETPDRTYCHRPGCSTFIPPRAFVMGGDVGACPRCGAHTCAVCKQEAPHPGGDCPEDRGLQEVLRVAAENEWQRCYSCHSVVELQSGCHHISKSHTNVSLWTYTHTSLHRRADRFISLSSLSVRCPVLLCLCSRVEVV